MSSKRGGYYNWLMDIIGGPGDYSLVLNYLYHEEYSSPISMDENRAEDGLEMRYYYEVDTGKICDKTGPCTVLEMMIGLAYRVENDFLYDPKVGNRVGKWFWDMFFNANLENLYVSGQKKWANGHFYGAKVDRHGRLELFKMAQKPPNWDDFEVWKQLCRYISWKFE